MATRENSQVSAELVTSLLKSEKQRTVLILSRTLITTVLCGILAKWSYEYFMWSVTMRPATAVYKLRMYIAHCPLLLSFVLSVLYELGHICHGVAEVGRAFGFSEQKGSEEK